MFHSRKVNFYSSSSFVIFNGIHRENGEYGLGCNIVRILMIGHFNSLSVRVPN